MCGKDRAGWDLACEEKGRGSPRLCGRGAGMAGTLSVEPDAAFPLVAEGDTAGDTVLAVTRPASSGALTGALHGSTELSKGGGRPEPRILFISAANLLCPWVGPLQLGICYDIYENYPSPPQVRAWAISASFYTGFCL